MVVHADVVLHCELVREYEGIDDEISTEITVVCHNSAWLLSRYVLHLPFSLEQILPRFQFYRMTATFSFLKIQIRFVASRFRCFVFRMNEDI